MILNPIRPILAHYNRHKHIKKQARNNKEVVYGARAMNIQLSRGFLEKHTFDWDIFSKQPRKSAMQLERTMDRAAGSNSYYVKAAMHPGTFKVMGIGADRKKGTRDDVGIVDYTNMPGRVKTITQNGIRYRHISIEKQRRKEILKLKKFAFRHAKDKEDLYRMKMSNKLMKVRI